MQEALGVQDVGWTHRRTRVIFIVTPLLHRVTNRKNSYTAFNLLYFFFFFFFFFFFILFYFQNGKVFHDVLIYSRVNNLNEKLTTTE